MVRLIIVEGDRLKPEGVKHGVGPCVGSCYPQFQKRGGGDTVGAGIDWLR